MISHSSSLRQSQTMYLKPSINPAYPWILDCFLQSTAIPLLWNTVRFDAYHVFLSIIFIYKIFLSLRRFSPIRGTAKVSTLFLNLFNYLLRTIAWVSMVVSVDGLRKLAKPLKQPEGFIYESWASISQSCFCPMLTATDVNREFVMKYESLTWTGHLLLYKAGTCHSSRTWLLFSIMDKIWVCILHLFSWYKIISHPSTPLSACPLSFQKHLLSLLHARHFVRCRRYNDKRDSMGPPFTNLQWIWD